MSDFTGPLSNIQRLVDAGQFQEGNKMLAGMLSHQLDEKSALIAKTIWEKVSEKQAEGKRPNITMQQVSASEKDKELKRMKEALEGLLKRDIKEPKSQKLEENTGPKKE